MATTLRDSIPLAALTALLVAAPAHAATFKGETDQGRRMLVRQDDAGKVESILFGWRMPCSSGGYYSHSTRIVPPITRNVPPKFSDFGGYEEPAGGPYVAWVRVHMRGFHDRDDPRGEHIRGEFRIRVTVRRGGREVDSCGMRRAVRFRLRPVR